MDYKEKIKELGLDLSEKIIIEILIPFLEEKVKETTNTLDDALLATLKPILIEFVDKIDGETNLEELPEQLQPSISVKNSEKIYFDIYKSGVTFETANDPNAGRSMLKKIIEIIAQVLLIPLIQKWVEQYRLRKQIEKEHDEIDKQHT